MRTALAARLELATTPLAIQETSFTPEEVHTLVKRHLDPALLRGLHEVSGSDFHFDTATGQAQVAVLALSYRDAKTAAGRADCLNKLGGHFRRTKILTPFSSTTIEHRLIVGFTENAGNQAVVDFVHALPELLVHPAR